MAVICHDSPEVANYVKTYMRYLRERSDRLTKYYRTEDGRSIHHGAKLPKRAMYILLFASGEWTRLFTLMLRSYFKNECNLFLKSTSLPN